MNSGRRGAIAFLASSLSMGCTNSADINSRRPARPYSSQNFPESFSYNTLRQEFYVRYQGEEIQASRNPALMPRAEFEPSGFFFPSVDKYLDANPALGVAIAKDGVIFLERYRAGLPENELFNSYSASKGMVAALTGVALQEGHIKSVDDEIGNYCPEINNSDIKKIRIKDLLSMRSGIQFDAGYNRANETDIWQDITFKSGKRKERSGVDQRVGTGSLSVIERFSRISSPPGSRYYYSSFDSYLLCYVIEAASKKRFTSLFAEKILEPIGFEFESKWLTDDDGLFVGGEGAFLALRDYLKIGCAFAGNGSFNGKQILPESWVREMTATRSNSFETGARDRGFGYQTWVMSDGCYAFLGARGQGVFVNPSTRVVMAHFAAEPHHSRGYRSQMIPLWDQIKSGRGW